MSYLGTFHIDDYVGIPAATHRFSSGAAYAPTTLTYSIYEEATATGLDEDVDMTVASPFDSITGCYWVRRQLTTAAGFEAGKNYIVVVKATVDSVAAIQMHTFQIETASVAQTGDSYARLGAPAGASVSADIAAVKTQTGAIETDTQDLQTQIGTDGAGLTAIGDARLANLDATVSSRGTSTLDAAGVRTAVGLASANLDTQLGAIPTLAEMQGEFAALADDTDIATAVRTELATELAEISATNLTTDKLDTALELDGAVYRYTTNALEQAPGTDAASVADAVWDEALAGHAGAGSAGAVLSAASGAADPLLNSVPGAYAAGTAGYIIGSLTAGVVLTIPSPVSGSTITATIAASLAATLTGLTISADWTAIYLTVKSSANLTDANSMLQVVVSNPAAAATDGALYVQKAAATAAQRTQASLTVTQATGTIAIALDEVLTGVFKQDSALVYDLKEITASGAANVLCLGNWNFQHTPTWAV